MQVFYNPSFVTHDAQRLSYRASDEHINRYTVAVKRRLVILSAHHPLVPAVKDDYLSVISVTPVVPYRHR